MKNIAIFFGGQSPEHEISILTGVQAFHSFDTSKYKVIPIYVARNGLFYTRENLTDMKEYKDMDTLMIKSRLVQIVKEAESIFILIKKTFGSEKIKIDCAFLAFHGAGGEGGSFQGYCESLGLPYTGSGVLGSSICMDKVTTKKILEKEGVPVSEYAIMSEDDFIKEPEQTLNTIEAKIGYPIFVKPSNGGSSIGVSRANNRKEFERAAELAFSFDSKVLVEKEFTHDTEVNISCLGTWNKEVQTSELEEVYSDSEFLDFENKYMKGAKSKKTSTSSGSKGMASTSRKIPAEITNEMKSKIKEAAEKTFKTFNCSGVARIDFLVNKKENSFVLVEVNTIPGSLSYYLWEPAGVPFPKLIDKMVDLAFETHADKMKHARKFTSNIFKNL